MKRTVIIAAIAVVALAIGAFFDLRQALASYLLGYLFVLGIVLGSTGLALLHALTGGRWGEAIAGPVRAAIGTIPFMAILSSRFSPAYTFSIPGRATAPC